MPGDVLCRFRGNRRQHDWTRGPNTLGRCAGSNIDPTPAHFQVLGRRAKWRWLRTLRHRAKLTGSAAPSRDDVPSLDLCSTAETLRGVSVDARRRRPKREREKPARWGARSAALVHTSESSCRPRRLGQFLRSVVVYGIVGRYLRHARHKETAQIFRGGNQFLDAGCAIPVRIDLPRIGTGADQG